MQHLITPVKNTLSREVLERAKRVHEENSKKETLSKKLDSSVLNNEKVKELFETMDEVTTWIPEDPSLVTNGKNMKLWAFLAHGLVPSKRVHILIKLLMELGTPALCFDLQSKTIVDELNLAKWKESSDDSEETNKLKRKRLARRITQRLSELKEFLQKRKRGVDKATQERTVRLASYSNIPKLDPSN